MSPREITWIALLLAGSSLMPGLPSEAEWACIVAATAWIAVRLRGRGDVPWWRIALWLSPWAILIPAGWWTLVAVGQPWVSIDIIRLSVGIVQGAVVAAFQHQWGERDEATRGARVFAILLSVGLLLSLWQPTDGRVAFLESNPGLDSRALVFALWWAGSARLGATATAAAPASSALAFVALVGFALGWTDARSVILSAVAVWGAVLLSVPALKRHAATFVVVMGIALLGARLHPDLRPPFAGLIDGDHYRLTSGRTAIWTRGAEIVRDHFPAGIGVGRFPEVYERYRVAAEARGERRTKPFRGPESIVLQLLAEYGAAGLIALGGVVLLGVATASDPVSRAGFLLWLGSSLTHDSLLHRTNWLMLGLLIGRVVSRRG